MPVKVQYDGKEKLVSFRIYSSTQFSGLIGKFKETKCKYNANSKTWECSPMKFADVLASIDSIDEVYISPEIRNKIESDKFIFSEVGTVFKRKPLRESLVLYPSIKGKAPYEKYQDECILKGIQQNRLALFLPVGSGKTYVATSILNHFFEDGEFDKLLILSPPEGIINWKRELKKFSTFAQNESDICISLVDKNRYPFENDPKVIITTYRHFLTMSDDYYKQRTGKKSTSYRTPCIPFETWGTKRAIILDESHKIKNIKSRTAKVVLMHSPFFEVRQLLTGTPTPNSFDEIYPQIKFLDESLVPDYHDWLQDVAIMGTKFSQYQIAGFKEEKVKEWENRFNRWVVKYNAKDILDLPEMYEKKTYVEMSAIQLKLYRHVIEDIFYKVKKKSGRFNPIMVLDSFPYLRQALDNPELLKGKIVGSEVSRLVEQFKFERDHAKLDVLQSILENHDKAKVIIFDYHPLTIELLAKRLHKRNPLVVHGTNTPRGYDDTEWRESQYDIFRKSPDHNLLIASSKVLTTSANLQEANVLVYFSRDYSYLTYVQSKARAYRLGQKKTVYVYPLIFQDTLDETIDRVIDGKDELNRNVFANNESLTMEQWKAFFEGKEIK